MSAHKNNTSKGLVNFYGLLNKKLTSSLFLDVFDDQKKALIRSIYKSRRCFLLATKPFSQVRKIGTFFKSNYRRFFKKFKFFKHTGSLR